MNNNIIADIENISRQFLALYQGSVSWKWDVHRISAALAEFAVEEEPKVRAVLLQHFTDVWNVTNIDSAPENVQQIQQRFGTLRPGQMLFAADTDNDVSLFCAWWPWSNGQTFSIRVSLFCNSMTAGEEDDLNKAMRDCFGIEDE